MGMGEPLHNYDETMKALRILADEHGLALPPRRVTLSTVGLLPGARAAGARAAHAEPGDLAARADRRAARRSSCRSTRNTASPTIIEACRRFPLKRRSRITFEYVLLAGVNDSPDGRAPAGEAAGRREGEGQPDSAQRRAGHSVRAAVGRGGRSLRADPGRPRRHGVGAQEPRPRHPRRVRSADRRRAAKSPAQQLAARIRSD